MYRCYKLSLDLWELEQNQKEFIDSCKSYGKNLKKQLEDTFEEQLENAIDENGVISGEEFTNSWFPTENYDVFLSYSHDDEDIALIVAGLLKSEFKLKVFIDELFWGSADQLLRKLDNKYCKNEEGNYDYKKRKCNS